MMENNKSTKPWCASKVVIVTGGARGIGKNIARMFGEAGARVVICDKDMSLAQKASDEMRKANVDAEVFDVDLAKSGAPQRMIRDVVEKWGRVDVLVNNARAGKRVSMMEETEETWDAGISVTLRAAFFASQEAVRAMSLSGGGSIINIASVSAHWVGRESPVYHIAKAGMIQMTRYLGVHAGQHKVRVNAVLPGLIVQDDRQEMYHHNDNKSYRDAATFCHPVGYVGQSDDVARAVLFLASPDSIFISGQCLVVDGGLTLQDPSSLLFSYKNHNQK